MSAWFRDAMEVVGTVLDGIGVVLVGVGAIIATCRYVVAAGRREAFSYRTYRQNLGRAILLGLEFLVAGDIIRTVVVAPTLVNVVVLGIIVLIRTMLSMTLQLEVEGRWPWQRGAGDSAARLAAQASAGPDEGERAI